MKPGDPFETEALDELRAKQRRDLRLVPDWLFERYGPSPSQTIDTTENTASRGSPGLVEHELRGLAEKDRGELGDLPAQMERDTLATVRWTAVRDWGAEVTATGLRVARGYVFHQKSAELHQETLEATLNDDLELDLAAALTRYVHLLVWADELASDGYIDPRLENRLSR